MDRVKYLITELFSLADRSDTQAQLYAIVDAGIYRTFIDLLDIEAPMYRILFKDLFVREYENVAPYLIVLEKGDAFTERIVSEGYGKTWLSFVISGLDIDPLAEALKGYINPYSQKHAQEIIFRFYDPRNMRRYVEMLTPEEFDLFSSDIEGFLLCIDTNEPSVLQCFESKQQKTISLLKETV